MDRSLLRRQVLSLDAAPSLANLAAIGEKLGAVNRVGNLLGNHRIENVADEFAEGPRFHCFGSPCFPDSRFALRRGAGSGFSDNSDGCC